MKSFIFFAKIGISCALISWLVIHIDWQHTLSTLKHFDLIFAFPLLGIGLSGILLSVWKWSLSLKYFNQNYDFVFLLKTFWTGLFFNNFLPGRTGGDLYRTYELAKRSSHKTEATLSVVVDRILNLVALLGIGLFGYWQSPSTLNVTLNVHNLLWGSVLCLTLGGIVIFFLKKRPFMAQVQKSLSTLIEMPFKLLSLFSLALIYQTLMVISHLVVFKGLGQHIAPSFFFYLIPLTALVTLLPISFNGFGLRESAFVVAFSQIGVAPEQALALSLIITFFTMGLSVVGGIIYASNQATTPHQQNQNTSLNNQLAEKIICQNK